MTANSPRGARQTALFAGVLLLGVAVAWWGAAAPFTRERARRRRHHSPENAARRDSSREGLSGASQTDIALAERNDRYAG